MGHPGIARRGKGATVDANSSGNMQSYHPPMQTPPAGPGPNQLYFPNEQARHPYGNLGSAAALHGYAEHPNNNNAQWQRRTGTHREEFPTGSFQGAHGSWPSSDS